MRALCAVSIVAPCLLAIGKGAAAFTSPSSRAPPLWSTSALHLQNNAASESGRRAFLVKQIIAPAMASMATAAAAAHPAFADALLMDKASPDVPAFKGGVDEAKNRFRLAIKDIDSLLNNYDEISKSGGDNVRLYLGTQGVKSNMYGISKVLKVLKDEADDIVEFTETANEFEAYLYQAEGAAYQSLFVEHSSAKGTPESLLKTARGDIVSMRKYMGDLALQLNLDA